MRLAIMQPYFMPYIGYFQLMAVVDKIVLLDDVNFINRGWINRNRVAVSGVPHWITVPLVKASQNRLINEIEIVEDDSWKRKILRTIELSYHGAPQLNEGLLLLSDILDHARGSLSVFLSRQLRQVANYLGINVLIQDSSVVYPKEGRTGQDRILDICLRERAMIYVNLPGGQGLYDPARFIAAGVELRFLDPNFRAMTLQHGGKEGPSLSILDLLMFNPVGTIREAIAMARVDAK